MTSCTIEAFRQEHRAVTLQGQVRSGDRHEKDDRSRVDDPRTWVLGWANERKVAALTEQLIGLQGQIEPRDERLAALKDEASALAARLGALSQLSAYGSWEELDWVGAQAQAETDEAERQRLVSGSSELAELTRRLEDNETEGKALTEELSRLTGDIRVLEERIGRARAARDRDQSLVATQDDTVLAAARAAYPALQERLGTDLPQEADACAAAQESLITALQTVIDRIGRELGGYTQSLLAYMSEVRRRWPEATTEMDASVEARADYLAFHEREGRTDSDRAWTRRVTERAHLVHLLGLRAGSGDRRGVGALP